MGEWTKLATLGWDRRYILATIEKIFNYTSSTGSQKRFR